MSSIKHEMIHEVPQAIFRLVCIFLCAAIAWVSAAWLFSGGFGAIDGYFFPASTKMQVVSVKPTSKRVAYPNTKDLEDPKGNYSAIYVEFRKLRHNPPFWYCKPRELDVELGKRNSASSPIGYYWGKPKNRKDGIQMAGPWVFYVHTSVLDHVYVDVLHQCYLFKTRLPWITRTQFYH